MRGGLGRGVGGCLGCEYGRLRVREEVEHGEKKK